jgi:uncharacterized membrane protein YphA (DoxX/SURF4 family)
MYSYRKLSTLAIIALVILRVAVGWHFFKEGATKVKEGGFSSVGFLGAAVGPMSPYFHSMIPDYDGQIRTDKDTILARIDAFHGKAKSMYGFDADQSTQLERAVAKSKGNIADLFKQQEQVILEYKNGFDRNAFMDTDRARSGVASLAGQKTTIEQDWKSKIKPVLKEIDGTLNLLAVEAKSIAKPEQLQRAGVVKVTFGDEHLVETSTIDKIIPIFDMVVGILLVIGLLTPVAGIAAGLFLISVVLTQFPGAPGAAPTYYQAIEAAACFVLAFADAGRYAGLDFIPWAFWNRRVARTSKAAVASA